MHLSSTSGGIFFGSFLLIWLNIHECLHTDTAFASGQAAVTRIWAGEHPSSFQTSAHMTCALSEPCDFISAWFRTHLCFQANHVPSWICIFSLIPPCLQVIYCPRKNATFIFNTSLHGKKFSHYLIVLNSFLLLHGFSLTPFETFLIWEIQVHQNKICKKYLGHLNFKK